MKQTTTAAALISVLVFVTASVSVEAGSFAARKLEFKLDHFKCYRASTVPFETIEGITLEDQFDEALGREELVDIFVFLRFCNPADKLYLDTFTPHKHEGHLTLYHFNPDPEEEPIRGSVVVVNQFGQQQLEIESARILAVPTAKVPGEDQPEETPDIPTDLDHYKCYYATGRAPDPGVVGLIDQFETHTFNHKLREPLLFCNPVKKTDAGGKEFKIQNDEDHLTCYDISILTELDRPAWIFNQFTPSIPPDNYAGTPITAKGADILCVPSKKVSFKLVGPRFGRTSPGGRDDEAQCTPNGGVANCTSNADCDGDTICQNVRNNCECVAPR